MLFRSKEKERTTLIHFMLGESPIKATQVDAVVSSFKEMHFPIVGDEQLRNPFVDFHSLC